jgi:hypothetical protein
MGRQVRVRLRSWSRAAECWQLPPWQDGEIRAVQHERLQRSGSWTRWEPRKGLVHTRRQLGLRTQARPFQVSRIFVPSSSLVASSLVAAARRAPMTVLLKTKPGASPVRAQFPAEPSAGHFEPECWMLHVFGAGTPRSGHFKLRNRTFLNCLTILSSERLTRRQHGRHVRQALERRSWLGVPPTAAPHCQRPGIPRGACGARNSARDAERGAERDCVRARACRAPFPDRPARGEEDLAWDSPSSGYVAEQKGPAQRRRSATHDGNTASGAHWDA